ncbi:hypothetical protein [Marinomonas shanghaiensis]
MSDRTLYALKGFVGRELPTGVCHSQWIVLHVDIAVVTVLVLAVWDPRS